MYYLDVKHEYRRERSAQESSGDRLKRFLLIVSIIIGMMLIIVFTSSGSKPVQYVELKVDQGETLWKIAKSHYSEQEDFRKIIYRLKEINNLDSVVLQPGQIIRIPVLN